MRRLLLLPFAVTLALAGCDSCDKKPEAGSSTTPAASASASATIATSASAAPSASVAAADGGAAHPMTNCPTAVNGAVVAITDAKDGVEVTVTSKDDVAASEIKERAKKLVAMSKNDAGVAHEHNGSGSGGGQFGRCTIIMRNTTVAATDVPNGTKITVTPHDKKEVDWLRRETRERDKESQSASAAGAGALRMAHCPSAVDGAKTTVKDVKDGVVVSITGPADKLAEIRERARHTQTVAKKDEPGKVEHHGEGTGGGGVGRCPIVVEGDTVVDVKDTAEGVDVTVTTKKDVAALQKETRDRTEMFTKK